jgi:hypothetical protein
MDPEGSQCIRRSNTLEVKTPSLIVVIAIPLTYIYKFCYITIRCCSYDNNPCIVLILYIYTNYSPLGDILVLVPLVFLSRTG